MVGGVRHSALAIAMEDDKDDEDEMQQGDEVNRTATPALFFYCCPSWGKGRFLPGVRGPGVRGLAGSFKKKFEPKVHGAQGW